MNDIAHKAIVLKLNRLWKPVGVGLVWKTICDLMNGVVLGMDIHYALKEDGTPDFDGPHEYVEPVDWNTWITLPVRPWDLAIHSAKMEFRVPTVVITVNYSKVHKKNFKGKPTREALAIRDNLIDCYTGKELEYEEATIDHIVPTSRGGTDTYDNTALTKKETNNRKGNKLNSEAGLTLYIDPHNPKPILISHTIRKPRHRDWSKFLEKKE